MSGYRDGELIMKPELCLERKQNISDRFAKRDQAERYRDRFKTGRRRSTHQNEVEALERVLESLGRVNISMDVACGPGRFAEVLAGHSRYVLQTDFSFHMLNLSREDHPLGKDRTAYFPADARHLPLGDNTVDLVFCHRFLNHIFEPQDRGGIMRELARVSKQYVVVSCLGPPRIIRLIRRGFALLKGQSLVNKNVDVPDLVQSASEAGLVLKDQVPIRSFIKSAVFLVFHKDSR
jgi:SAM-dependent methyltransferase